MVEVKFNGVVGTPGVLKGAEAVALATPKTGEVTILKPD